MKYVIFFTRDQQPIVAIGFAPRGHKELAAPCKQIGLVPRSAGFARVTPDGEVIAFGYSYNLGLSPHPDDSQILTAHYKATLAIAPQ